MAQLKIIAKRNKFSINIPHKILINNIFIGIMNTKEINIEMPPGSYDVKVQSMVPLISSHRQLVVHEGVDNILTFEDREKWWDILFVIDIVLWCADFFFTLPAPWDLAYDIFTNGYFVLWLIYEWIIRKKYFRMEFVQKMKVE